MLNHNANNGRYPHQRITQLKSEQLKYNADADADFAFAFAFAQRLPAIVRPPKTNLEQQAEFNEMETIDISGQARISTPRYPAPLPKAAFGSVASFRSNTSMNSMGSTDSSGFTVSSPNLSPFTINPEERWGESPEARSFRSASTQPSRLTPLLRLTSKSAGQLDSLPNILATRNKAHQRALAGSPLARQPHIPSPRPNSGMLTNLDVLKRASSLPLDFESKSQPVAPSDVGFTLFQKGRDRRNALEGLPISEIKATPRLSDVKALYLTSISEGNTSLAATDDKKTSGPR